MQNNGTVIQAVADSGLVTGATVGINDFRNSNEVHMQFTASGAAAATSSFFPIPGAGSAARATLPTGVTYTGGAFSTYADAVDYFKSVGMQVIGMRISDSGTTNFTETMEFADVPPINNNIQERKIDLTSYRESVGNGFSDVIRVPEARFNVNAQTYLRMKIKQSTVLNIYFIVAKVGAKTFVPTN